MCRQAETQHFLHKLLMLLCRIFCWFVFGLGAGNEPEFESHLHHLSVCNLGNLLSFCACVPLCSHLQNGNNCLKVMTIQSIMTKVPCILVGPHSIVGIIIKKVFPIGISEETSLIILYKVVILYIVIIPAKLIIISC